MIAKPPSEQHEPVDSRRHSVASSIVGSTHRPSVTNLPPVIETAPPASIDRPRLTSLSDEADDWHGDHQEPIEIHPHDTPFAPPPPPPKAADVREIAQRRESNASTASSIRPVSLPSII